MPTADSRRAPEDRVAFLVRRGDRAEADRFASAEVAAAPLARLYNRLSQATYERPLTFSTELVEALQRELDLQAVSLYLHLPRVNGFRLKAAAGFSYEDYADFQLPYESYPGYAVSTDALYLIDEYPLSTSLYRDKNLLVDRDIAGIVVVPIHATYWDHEGTEAPDPLACLCLYPPPGGDLLAVAATVTAASPLLATLYMAALDRFLMHIRRLTVSGPAFKRDVGSLVHSFLETLQEWVPFDAASAWVWDPRRRMLYLRGTTGSIEGRLSDHFTTETGAGTIEQVFASGVPYMDSLAHPAFDSPSVTESLPGGLVNSAVFPISAPELVKLGGRGVRTLGVLVLLNKYTVLGGTTRYTDLTWEDEVIANFATEMMAVLIYQLLRTRDHESDYERQMHGARTNLQGSKANLQTLETRVGVARLLPQPYQHYISNCIDWIEDLERQISRNELFIREDLALSRIGLFGAVLAPVERLAVRSAVATGVNKFEIKWVGGLDRFREMPFVRGNSSALITVFRNLIENSIKYRSRGKASWVAFDWAATASELVVEYADNGIGIPTEDLPFLFDEGFRGEAARAINTQGLGVGLSDCQHLLVMMGGAIETMESSNGARFMVRLQRTGQ